MKNSTAHIIITDLSWFNFLKDNNVKGEVNFYREDTRSINNIHKNDRIYFLNKKEKNHSEKIILGMALFERYVVLNSNEAWNIWGKNNGCESLYDFSRKFTLPDIGCIVLKDIVFFEDPIPLSKTKIPFEKNIQSRKLISATEEINILNIINGYEINDNPFFHDKNKEGKNINYLRTIRVNQTYFRNSLFNIYDKCVVCGLSNKNLLSASHSKPWSESNPNEKVDPMNGLLLCPNHDALYDKHLISFDENKKILISQSLNKSDISLLNIPENLHINVPDEAMKFIAYHRLKFLENN